MRFACSGTWERDTNYTNGHEPRDSSVNWFGPIRADAGPEPMGSATQKAKPRREAASEPGGKRVSNSCRGCRCLKGFALLVYFVGKKIIRSRSWMRLSTDKERPRKLSGSPLSRG